MTAKDWTSRMIIEGFMEERKEKKDKGILRAEVMKVIFDISIAIGVPFEKAQENIINLGNEIKKFERRTV